MKSLSRLACVALLVVWGCGSESKEGASAPTGSGTIAMSVTDAPFAHDIVERADVWISEVKIRGAGGFRTLSSGAPVQLDLANLRNGLTQHLVTADVPAGEYDQIRLVVERAFLRLVDGDEFDSELGTLDLTSSAQSGLKLNVDPPLTVGDGVSRSVLLDFDLTKTFHCVPGTDPLAATSYQLHPVVHVSNESDSGEIRGAVREDDGAGNLAGVADATVYLLAPGELDVANALRSTATEVDGSYAMLGVPPGTYDLLAALGERESRSDAHAVAAGSVTIVDFVLP